MPGVVCLHVWQKYSDPLQLEHLHARRLAVFDALPGQQWRGFATFMTSLTREYNGAGIYDHGKHVQLPGGAPDIQGPSIIDLLPDLRDSFVFPVTGELHLTIVVDKPASDAALPRVVTPISAEGSAEIAGVHV